MIVVGMIAAGRGFRYCGCRFFAALHDTTHYGRIPYVEPAAWTAEAA
jgi:hypothetical protein